MSEIPEKHMEVEVEIKMNKEGGKGGDGSRGDVIEITNEREGTVGAAFLSVLFLPSILIHPKPNISFKIPHYEYP